MELYNFTFHAMGTVCSLHLYAGSRPKAENAAAAAVSEVDRLERRYSRYRPENLMSAINKAAAEGSTLHVDIEVAGLLDYAFVCYESSGGLFDVTSGLLRNAWDFAVPRLPSRADIERLLPRVGMDKLRWDPPHLGFSVVGMELDFGGIVKEYAADRAAQVCLDNGVAYGAVELGGDVRVIGPHPDGQPWRIGIRHPRRADETFATAELAGGGLASSGDYERFFVVGDRRYCHILNPRTGWPVQGLAAVSAMAETCLAAGCISSIAMLKEEEGVAWLETLGCDCVWMDRSERQGGSLL